MQNPKEDTLSYELAEVHDFEAFCRTAVEYALSQIEEAIETEPNIQRKVLLGRVLLASKKYDFTFRPIWKMH